MENQEKFNLLKKRIIELRQDNEKLQKEKQDLINALEDQVVNLALKISNLKKEKQALKTDIDIIANRFDEVLKSLDNLVIRIAD